MAAVLLACVLAVPGEARVNVVYQRQDSLRIVGLLQQGKGDEEETSQLDALVLAKQMAGVSACGRHAWTGRRKRCSS